MSSLTPTTSLLLLLLPIFFLLLIGAPPAIAAPLSTVSIASVSNNTIVCALVLSSGGGGGSVLNCTSVPKKVQHSYPSGAVSFSAIAAGDGFLCGLAAQPHLTVNSMIWWAFEEPTMAKRLYRGPPLSELVAGDNHVCGVVDQTQLINCWRWPELSLPAGRKFSGIAVGGNFVCALSESREVECFGNNTNVVGNEPTGNFSVVAAGTNHACAVSVKGLLICWGIGTPRVVGVPFEFVSLAVGENCTCALRSNGTVACWGDGFELPENLRNSAFLSLDAKGRSFCGILTSNYSLICWGTAVFQASPVVFERVLPGPCKVMSTCSCGILAGSGNICSSGAICQPCEFRAQVSPPPPFLPPANNSTKSLPNGGGGARLRRLVLIVVGSVGLGIGLAALSGFLYFRYYKGKRRSQVHDSGRLGPEGPSSPLSSCRRARARAVDANAATIDSRLSEFLSKGHSSTIEEFPLQVLVDATDDFSDEHRIGSGSFGTVYRATLDDGREVAIKRAEMTASSSYAGAGNKRQDKETAFLSELALLSRVNHKNLVRLFGFCREENERMLVYEYMANKTLHDHLHRLLSTPLTSWIARMRVAVDAARGIEYLHKYAVPPIIHRDIKSSNILLDDMWTAKVSDFGLSLMGPDDDTSHISLRAAGTVGYMDPEYYRLQYLTTKSDVYSFGVVLLELLSGYKAIHRYSDEEEDAGAGGSASGAPRNVVDFAVPHINAGEIHKVLDPKLPPPKPCEIEAVMSVGYLAADCVSPEGRDRPTMTEIVSSLERAAASCGVVAPPQQPGLPRSMTTRSV